MSDQGGPIDPDDEPCDWLDRFTGEDARRAFNTILWTCIGFGFGVVFGFLNPLGFGL